MNCLWAELQSAKNIQKATLERLFSYSMQKSGRKKHWILEKWPDFQNGRNGHFEKAVVMQNDKNWTISEPKKVPNTYGRMVKIHARVVAVREKRVEIRPNIREKMRFWKVEKKWLCYQGYTRCQKYRKKNNSDQGLMYV